MHDYLRSHLQTSQSIQLNFTKFSHQILRSDRQFRSLDEASQRRIDASIEAVKDSTSQQLLYLIGQAAIDVVLLLSVLALALTTARGGHGPTVVLPPASAPQTQPARAEQGITSPVRTPRVRFRREAPPPPSAPTATPSAPESESLVAAVTSSPPDDFESYRMYEFLAAMRRDTSAPPGLYPRLC